MDLKGWEFGQETIRNRIRGAMAGFLEETEERRFCDPKTWDDTRFFSRPDVLTDAEYLFYLRCQEDWLRDYSAVADVEGAEQARRRDSELSVEKDRRMSGLLGEERYFIYKLQRSSENRAVWQAAQRAGIDIDDLRKWLDMKKGLDDKRDLLLLRDARDDKDEERIVREIEVERIEWEKSIFGGRYDDFAACMGRD
jgi:hypothetical protein